MRVGDAQASRKANDHRDCWQFERNCRAESTPSSPWGFSWKALRPGIRRDYPCQARAVAMAAMPAWVLQAITAIRKVPWRRVLAAILWLNTEGRRYWNRLSPDERGEVRDLALVGARRSLTQGRGAPSSSSASFVARAAMNRLSTLLSNGRTRLSAGESPSPALVPASTAVTGRGRLFRRGGRALARRSEPPEAGLAARLGGIRRAPPHWLKSLDGPLRSPWGISAFRSMAEQEQLHKASVRSWAIRLRSVVRSPQRRSAEGCFALG